MTRFDKSWELTADYDLEGLVGRLPSVDGLTRVSILPDLFEGFDGAKVATQDDWRRRRGELALLAQYYVFGFVNQPESVTYERDSNDATQGTVVMTHAGRTASFPITVWVPERGRDTEVAPPYPVLIQIGSPCAEEQRREWLRHGYAMIEMPAREVYSDDAARSGAYTTLFPYQAGHPRYDSGALRGWTWGVSRVVDVLEQGAYPTLNPEQILVTGVSRYGKAALLAAAFDERIALALPVDTGQAGASGFRYNVEGRIYGYIGNPFPEGMGRSEKIYNMMGGLSHWFSSRIADFSDAEDRLPFDAHSMLALVAPRPMVVFGGEEADWLSQPSTVLSYVAAKEVYEFLDAGSRIGLNVRKGPHAIQNQDVAIAIDFANHVFRGEPLHLASDVFPYRDTYEATPYVADTAYVPWSRPGKHRLWTEQEQILAGHAVELTVYSDGEQVTLTRPSSWFSPTEPITVSVADGQAVFRLSAEEAIAGTYHLTAEGGLDSRTIGVVSVPWDLAFKTTISRDGTGRIIHFADTYDQQAVRVAVNGVDLTDVVDVEHIPDEYHRRVYRMRYGIRVAGIEDLAADGSGAYHIEVRHLRFRHFLPDQTFTLKFTVHAVDPGADGTERPLRLTSGLDTPFCLEA